MGSQESAGESAWRLRLAQRAAIHDAVREFFRSRGFLEVVTPVRVAAPAPEPHLDAIPVPGGFLRTSPELEMKRLLVAGCPRIFQLGPCFRGGEHGRWHREEFTMLEWYEAGAGYRSLVPFTRDLLNHAAAALGSEGQAATARLGLAGPWLEISVHEAFAKYAGESPEAALRAGRFEELLVGQVEPALPRERPVVLMDYPAELAALAQVRADAPALAERWELYLGGIELANAYGELTDPAEYRRRFAKFATERTARGAMKYPEATSFMTALAAGMPEASGCALGMDRLVMLLVGTDSLADLEI